MPISRTLIINSQKDLEQILFVKTDKDQVQDEVQVLYLVCVCVYLKIVEILFLFFNSFYC